jgi:hypothetical protein
MGIAAAERCNDFGWHPRGAIDPTLVAAPLRGRARLVPLRRLHAHHGAETDLPGADDGRGHGDDPIRADLSALRSIDLTSPIGVVQRVAST